MATTKQLVCLANSRKHNGRCIAGIEIGSNTWVRPVSDRPGHEVSERERKYPSGTEPRVLDIISMRLVKHQPYEFQRENWLLDSNVRWKKERQIGWDDLCLLEQHPRRLWINSDDSTRKGINDRVPVVQQAAVVDSLKFIRVDSVTIRVDASQYDNGLEVRAEFRHVGSTYILKVTDCIYERKFRERGVGRYKLADSFLTVSLGEEFNGYLYKMVAAIIECVEVK